MPEEKEANTTKKMMKILDGRNSFETIESNLLEK